jgi:hypothetical protein
MIDVSRPNVNGTQGHPQDALALQHEMDSAREDMTQSLERLRFALRARFDLRHWLVTHPRAALTIALAGGVLLTFSVRRGIRRARERRALAALAEASQRRGWPLLHW